MTFLNNILEFIFPERADAARIRDVTPETMRSLCKPTHVPGAIALARFKDPLVRACIHEIKFHNNEKGAVLLGAMLAAWLRENITQPTILVPVPLAGARVRTRGYNQVERIARAARDVSPLLAIDTRMLVRTRDTKPQTLLAKDERRENVRGAFSVRRGARRNVTGAHIILLDDVTTTGATLAAAKAAVQPYCPASITCLAIAH